MSKKGKDSEGFRAVNCPTAEGIDILKARFMMDFFNGHNSPYYMQPRMMNPQFGLDFTGNYEDDEYDHSDDSDDFDNELYDQRPYCGFSKKFLDRHQPASTIHHSPFTPLREITAEEAEKNAKELLDEEERVKQKAEKRKLKKMRQKERKRQEKTEKEIKNESKNSKTQKGVTKINTTSEENKSNEKDPKMSLQKDTLAPLEKNNNDVISNESSEDESKDESTKSEGELDFNSCFISSIARRKKELKPKLGKKEKNKPSPNRLEGRSEGEQEAQQQNGTENGGEDIIRRSMELAVIGNQFACNGRYEGAVMYFTDAIKHNPKEYRLFGNRSYCYEKLQQHEKALGDADISLSMCPAWTKGFFRKGRALVGLKRYAEASQAFKEVLKLDSTCTDAAQELMRVQIIQLMEMGFTREQSSNALIIHGTVEKALEALSTIHDGKLFNDSTSAVGTSQVAEEEWIVSGKKSHLASKPAHLVQPQPNLKSKSNHVKTPAVQQQPPLKLFAVWVGNVTSAVPEKLLRDIFGSTGEIHSMRVLYNRRCAFINYTNKDSADKAILAMNGFEVEGAKLIVRYPDNTYKFIGAAKPLNPLAEQPAKTVNLQKASGECFFWRTSECTKKEKCIYKHVPEHKGIDHKWNAPS
ncbi:uncharacterized protein LOC136766298 isoform X2 [Amia ocellicauda]|uniref:uncharacterized protein LOC136766298 isoform X2 n=1 Tax=Amia ocellicauda TaxID=2972642 RepID=UPI003464392A